MEHVAHGSRDSLDVPDSSLVVAPPASSAVAGPAPESDMVVESVSVAVPAPPATGKVRFADAPPVTQAGKKK